MKYEKLLPQNSKRRAFVKKIYDKLYGNEKESDIYQKWIEKNEPTEEELEKQRNTTFKLSPKISILVPVYNTPENFFKELVESLQNQTYSNWELCLADGSPKAIEYMKEYAKNDDRIKYSIIGENKGISGNTNEALKLATGDFIGLLDHDDLLPIFSLYEVVKAINENPDVEFLYTDEDKIETLDKPRYGAFFKPDFSPYTLRSANYICHFSIFKKELMDKLGGFRSEYDGSQDFDIVTRASENTDHIVHIPKVLYHWRVHQNSTAGNSDSKPYAFEVGKKVIKDTLKRHNIESNVEDGLTPGSYEVTYEVRNNPKVSIIIDGMNIEKEEIEKILEKVKMTTYHNVEYVILSKESIEDTITIEPDKNKSKFENYNKAVENATGEYFMIVDKELIKIDREDYIERLLGICQDEEVGIVGTKLYNKNDLVEHSGIILGMNGAGDFLYKGAYKNAGTYMQRLTIIHNVSCLYVKYALMRKEIFHQIGGFTDEVTGRLVSIDTCLKLLDQNKQVVINPIISICVKELQDGKQQKEEVEPFKEKWNKHYELGDRFFSPNLSKKDTGLSFEVD